MGPMERWAYEQQQKDGGCDQEEAHALRPCPFCGGHAAKVHHYFANRMGDDGEFKHVVRFHGMCTACGACGPTCDTLHHQHAEARAVRAWNGEVTPNVRGVAPAAHRTTK